MRDAYEERPSGARAIAGAVIAVVGAVAAMKPEPEVLRAINDAVPHLAAAVPALITACGAIIAEWSHPPKLGEDVTVGPPTAKAVGGFSFSVSGPRVSALLR